MITKKMHVDFLQRFKAMNCIDWSRNEVLLYCCRGCYLTELGRSDFCKLILGVEITKCGPMEKHISRYRSSVEYAQNLFQRQTS